MPQAVAHITTATTTALVAAPTSGYISVTGYQVVAKNMDGAVLLKSGTSLRAGVPLPATGEGGMCCPPVDVSSEPYFDCAAAQALNAVTDASGDCYVMVQYVIRGADYTHA